ncbi:hypothetical protein DSM104299_02138 [Baekduia alba]|uniref:PucR family transcriptional regulator n=1 Tax=Baekduia alba TaxID=2997333 RepID=UPI002340A9C6|nr:helix-turn-helix domain-containing protein [Baekduia alba]WCB93425.1 hypothetical protein DSM104299_02138 [Baekduia alba]
MASLDLQLKDVSAWVEREQPRLQELMLERWHEQVPEYFDPEDPDFLAVSRESIASNLKAIADGLVSGRAEPAHLPPGAVDEALTAARDRVAWGLVDRTYRIGHAILWEELLAEIEDWPLQGRGRSDLLRVVSRYLFAYVDHVTGELAEIHQAERDRQLRGHELRQIAWVRDVLDGTPVTDEAGDYDLRREHVCVVAWGEQAELAITELGRRLDATVLIVPGQGSALWGWVGGRPTLPERWDTALASFAPAGDTSMSLGDPADGADGFRRTHRQATEAARVARLVAPAVVRYRDVALEALLLRDERAARAFVDERIGTLLVDDDRTRVLLETLVAYVDAGWVAASAAARLGVHERTIAYRLATIEKRLDHPLTQRRLEVGAALRIAGVARRAG